MRKTKAKTAERRGELWLVTCPGWGAVVVPGAHSEREAVDAWFRGAVPAGASIDLAEGTPRVVFPDGEKRSVWASPLKEALR